MSFFHPTTKKIRGRRSSRVLHLEYLEDRTLLSGSHDAALLDAIRSTLSATNPQGLSTWSDRLTDVSILGKQLPLLGTQMGAQFSPRAQLNTQLSQLAPSYATLGQLSAGLSAIPGVTVLTTRDLLDNLEVDVRFVSTTTISVPIDSTFGGIHLAATGNVNVSVQLSFQLTVGAIWNGSATAYLGANSDQLRVTATVTGNSLSTTARLGFLDVTLGSPTTTMAAQFDLNLIDPGTGANADGRVTLSELNSTPVNTLIGTTVTANSGPAFSATLSSALIPGNQNLSINWASINSPATATSNLAALGLYKGFEQTSTATFTTGLTSFATWTGLANGLNMLGRALPIVSTQLADTVNINGLLQSLLVNNVGSYNSVDTFRTRLMSVFGLSGVTATIVGNEIRYTAHVNVHQTRNVSYESGLGSALELSLNAPSLTLAADVTGDLIFGVDLSTATPTFFVAPTVGPAPEFAINASLNAANFSATGGVGFVSVNATNGSASLVVNATLDLTAPSGHITGTDFSAGAATFGSLVTYAIAGTASTTVTLQSPLLGTPAQVLHANWPDLTNPSNVTANVADFAILNSYSAIAPATFSFGLTQVKSFLAQVAASNLGGVNPLKTVLPLVNRSAADLVNFGQFFTDAITHATDVTYVGGQEIDPFATSSDLTTLLQNLPGLTNKVVTATASANDIRYRFQFDKTVSRVLPLNLGIGSQINLNLTGSLTAQVAAHVDISFGVDSASGQFFLVDSANPVFAGVASVSMDVTADTTLGFLGVHVSHATATMAANIAVRLHDPSTDVPATPGLITANELIIANIVPLTDVSVAGTASASLPLSATPALFPDVGTLTINWGDVLHPETFSANTAAVQKFFNFNSITTASVLGGLQQLPVLLGHLIDTANLGKDIPLLGNNIKTLIHLASDVQSEINGLQNINTAQRLESELERVLNLPAGSIIPTVAANDIQYLVHFKQNLVNANVPFSVDQSVSGVGFQVGGTATVNGMLDASLRIGIGYAPALAAGDRFYIVTGVDSAVTLSAKATTTLNGTATLGLLTVNVSGTANLAGRTAGAIDTSKNATFTLGLQDPGPSVDGKITAAEIVASATLILAAPVLDGAVRVSAQLTGAGVSPPAPPGTIQLDWTDIGSPAAPQITANVTDFLNAATNYNAATATAGIQKILQLISSWSSVDLFNTKIPLINIKVSDIFNYVTEAQRVFNVISNTSTGAAFDAAVQGAVAAAGLNASEVTVTANPNNDANQYNPSQGKFRYLVDFHYNRALATVPFNFGSTLFSLNASFTPQFTFNVHFEFGLNKDQGFFIADHGSWGTKEVTIGLGLHVAIDKIGGSFGPLTYGVSNGVGDSNVALGIDLVDPSNNGSIGVSELLGSLHPDISGQADLNMPIGARLGLLGPKGPGITTTFQAHWRSTDPALFFFGPVADRSVDPAHGFSSINFELGDFITGLIGPVLQNIKKNNPLSPDIIKFLTTKLPLIDQTPLALITGTTGTPLDAYAPIHGVPKEINLLFEVLNVVNQIPAQGAAVDLSNYFASGESPPPMPSPGSPSGGTTGGQNLFTSFRDEIRNDFDISLPVLDDPTGSIVKLLLGQDIDLIRWHPGHFELPFNMPDIRIPFFTYGAPPALDFTAYAIFGGSISLFANVDIGLSTRGLTHDLDHNGQPDLNLLNGFFIGDNKPSAPNGHDDFEVGITAEVHVGVQGVVRVLGFDVVKLTGVGGISSTFGIDLADEDVAAPGDPNAVNGMRAVCRDDQGGDNRIYLDELAFVANNYGPFVAINPGGEVDFFLKLSGEVSLPFLPSFTVFSFSQAFPLISFHVPCDRQPPSNLAHVVGNELVMYPDTSTEKHQIDVTVYRDQKGNPTTLHIGKTVNNQDFFYQDFSLIDPADPTYLNPATINGIIVEGSNGDDVINVDPSITETNFGGLSDSASFANPLHITHVSVYGRDGNDNISYGILDPLNSWLVSTFTDAGSGNDNVLGTPFIDVVYAGDGDDSVTGYGGNDEIHGGAGNDILDGGAGDDVVFGDDGADTIFGGNGVNVLHGGAGDDHIYGGDQFDTIYGDDGADTIFAGAGNDIIHGGNGNDHIYAGAGNDFIYGEGGNDEIHGEDGDDYIEPGTGDDLVYGDRGYDLLYQKADGTQTLTDTTLQGLGNDIYDGVERVSLVGGAGADTFDVSGYTQTAYLDGQGGVNTVASTNDADFTLVDSNVTRSTGGSFVLASITNAALTGGPNDNTFDVTKWTGTATLTGGGGIDTVFAVNDANFTLTDTSLTRSTGGSFTLSGINSAKLTGGPGNNIIDASGFSGQTTLYGGLGNDVIFGGSGDDFIDGGFGNDSLYGNGGNDEIHGGGNGDLIDGGAGDDVLYGSDDAPDTIFGGLGNDRIYGYGGNDILSGGAGDDTIDGGLGDDTITGDAGADLLIGGAGNDVLYAFNSGGGDDAAVNYIYGDFGSNNNEANSGGDQIFGGTGNDLLFGEAGDDRIDGGGPSAIVDYGSGETAIPHDFVTPPTTPNPSPFPATTPSVPATLPTGVDYRGRWTEFASSATGGGLSASPGQANQSSVVAGAGGQYVAWADTRSGNSEIYVAWHSASTWQELGGSAHDGGVSATANASTLPSIALDSDGNPMVAWTEAGALSSSVRVSKFDPTANANQGAWIALGGAISAGLHYVSSPMLTRTAAGPVVAWVDTTASGVANVYVKQLVGATWTDLGPGGASGSGVSASATDVADPSLATDGAGKVAVAWSQSVGGGRQIYLREYSGGVWSQLAGSASGGGLSNLAGQNTAPTLAYSAGVLYAAWQGDGTGHNEIFAAQFTAGVWQAAGAGAASGGGISHSAGDARSPKLAAAAGNIYLVWTESRLANFTGDTTSLFTRRWNGAAFAEELAGDSSDRGFAGIVAPSAPAVSVDNLGHPFVSWTDVSSGKPQIDVRGNTFNLGTIYYVNDDLLFGDVAATAIGDAANSGLTPNSPKATVQQVLDAFALHAGDVILVDTGVYAAGFTVGPADAGASIFGVDIQTPTVQGPINITGSGVTVRNLTLTGNLTVSGANNPTLIDNFTNQAGFTISGGSGAQVVHNAFRNAGTAVVLTGGASGPTVEHNAANGADDGVAITAGGATGVEIRDNRLRVKGTGINISAAAAGHIGGNDIGAQATGIALQAAFTGFIENNDLHDGAIGLNYGVPGVVSANRIHNNSIGVIAVSGFGSVGGLPNDISRNGVGVQLTGTMQSQHVFANATGVAGSGSLTPPDLDRANVIEANAVGVDFSGPVEFNRIGRNGTGVVARSGQRIAHNLIYRNTIGVSVSGKTDTRIVSNTFYTPLGDNLRVVGGSSQTEVRDNIFWTENGYDIYVANDSVTGFFSDYNDLHASGSGKIGFWTKDFTDILDWQEDIAQFDLHSIGTTVVNPRWSEPRFFDKAQDDYRIFDESARQRFSSPTIDAGDPLTDLGLPPTGYTNLLANAGFESGLSGWLFSPNNATTQSANPAPWQGGSYFFAGPNPTTSIEQTVDLVAAGFGAAQLDNNSLTVEFGARARSLQETPADKGTLTATILDAANNVIGVPTIVKAANVSNRWELIGGRMYLPAGARKVKFHYDSVLQSGATNDAFLDGAFVYVTPNTTDPNLGAFGNTADEANQSHNAHLTLRTPDLYKDWERDKPINITWDSFGNTGNAPVLIDLYTETPQGPQYLLHISTGAPDTGSFLWRAVDSGINFGTYGLRVQISLAGNGTILTRGAETFTVPENTNTFFVNDKSIVGDEYTTTLGSNRNTGRLANIPKPYPNNVLRIYSLKPNQTLSVDTGDYPLIYPLLVSNIVGVGDDEGFRMRGAVNHATTLHHANPFTVAPVVELNNADFLTLDHFAIAGGTIGLWAHNFSTNLTASYLSASAATQDGFRIEDNSSGLDLNHLTATGNGGYGLYASGIVGNLSDGTFNANQNTGLYLINTGAATIENNEVAGNTGRYTYGVYITNNVANTTTLLGNPNLALGRGNRIHDNGSYGVYVSGQVRVVGNTIYGHVGAGNYGIVASGGPDIQDNVVHDNAAGISSSYNTTVTENRVYHNVGDGIVVDSTAPVLRNVVYSNAVGIRTQYSFAANILNNIIYANAAQGILMDGSGYYGGVREIVNNTIYQPTGDAIRIQGPASGNHLRNNILWALAGFDISVANEAQLGFQSDYNDLYTTGAGQVAFWQGAARPTLLAWQNTAFTDSNSLAQDPLFVNLLGPDGSLGYLSPAADGRDDDFHEKSVYGSYRGGALAPVATNNGTGAPAPQNPTLTLDAVSSLLIDRGDPFDPYANEPAPAGNFVNIGAYGNTSQASKSPATYVTVTKPDGGEVWPQLQTFPIRWRSQDLDRVALSFDGIDDVVDMGDPASNSLDLGASATLETWVKFDALPVSTMATFASKDVGGGAQNKWIFGYANNYGGVAGATIFHINAPGNPSVFLSSNAWTPVVGTWYHLAVVKSGNSYSFYRNGVLDGTANTTTAVPDVAGPFQLGRAEYTFPLKGQLDEIRLWNIARADVDIQASKGVLLNGNEAGLAAYWRVDEGNTTLLNDLTGHGNTGTLGGGYGQYTPAFVASTVPMGPTYSIDLMQQGNPVPVLNIAAAAPNTGQLLWSVPQSVTPNTNYLIRVTRNDASALTDVSNAPFTITTPISVYYVNDATVQGGDWTNAPGNDANDGLSIATPKASISAVLAAYHLNAGDTIRVDAGTYTLSTNLILNAAAAGIRIEGFHDAAYPTRATILDRGNTSGSAYAIELQNADNITLDHLKITGGYVGINAASGSDTDFVTISNCTIYNNFNYGIFADTSNDHWTISNSEFYGSGFYSGTPQYFGTYLNGNDAVVASCDYHNAPYTAVVIRGARAVISNNFIHANATGIDAYFSGALVDAIQIVGNRVTGTSTAISASGYIFVTNNEVYNNNLSAGQIGISMSSGGVATNNYLHDNGVGLSISYISTASNNRVVRNSTGIVVDSTAVVTSNRVYNNDVGIRTTYTFGASLSGNIVYSNATYGVLVDGSGYYSTFPDIANNVIQQSSGDNIHVQGQTNNVRIHNNILVNSAGYLLSVNPESERTFQSDFNLFTLTGTGKVALWEGHPFATRADWYYGLGFDGHSRTADPQFVNSAGADGILGFQGGGGLQASYYNTPDLSGSPVLTRVEPSINLNTGGAAPAPGVNAANFSVHWTGYVFIPTAGDYNFYTQVDDGVRFSLDGALVTDQWVYNGGAENSYHATAMTVGWHALSYDMRQLTGNSYAFLRWDGPGILKQIIAAPFLGTNNALSFGDFGADDDFHIAAGSRAADRGDLTSYYLKEPAPDGDRIDIGAYGNSSGATVSPTRLLQVLAPNGLEKYEQGQTVSVNWRSAGLTLNRPVALIDVGSAAPVDNFLADSFNVATAGSTSFANAVDTAAAANAAPALVYRTYAYSPFGVGAALSYQLPLPDGSYTVRLHFAEPGQYTTGGRRFDIRINGITVQSNFDIYAAAGGFYKATTLDLASVAAGGGGLFLSLVNVTSASAILSGIEILAANPGGSADPRVDLQLSADNGMNWSTFAANLPMDRYGRGTYPWTIPAGQTPGNGYQVRVIAAGDVDTSGTSDESFQIANSGHDYYINDNSTAGDVFTTAVGNNSNSGKTPGQPMADLNALIAAYTFEPNDRIHVDAGNYSLIQNVVLTAVDSGLRIEGPAANTAILNRGNTNNGAVVFELRNADNITLDHLNITGGSTGVSIANDSDSDFVTISNSVVANNYTYGIYAGTSNDHLTVSNTEFYGSGFYSGTPQSYGVWLYGDDAAVTSNDFHNAAYTAVVIRGARNVISNNFIHANSTGIDAYFGGALADAIQIVGNRVTGTSTAISASGNIFVTNNEVYSTILNANQTGISVSSGAVASNNFVHDNGIGISVSYNSTAANNRVTANTTGIFATSTGLVTGNRIYANATGILLNYDFSQRISNNLIYNNTAQGLWARSAGYYGGVQDIVNNTFYQPAGGDAVRVDAGAVHTHLRDNIFYVASGYALNVAADSQNDFLSDYNLFYLPGSGKLASWQGVDFPSRTNWFYQVGQDQHSAVGNPLFVDPANADFHVQPGSPVQDGGNPNDPWYFEPAPNGDRVDIGGYGNTPDALASSPQVIQILAPNGLEKVEQGQTVPVTFSSAGLTAKRVVSLWNAGAANFGPWMSANAQLTSGYNNATFPDAVDLSGVADPAPAGVYNNYAYSPFGVGSHLTYALPSLDGVYSLRLHFVEPTYTSAGIRRFDIKINGVTVRANYDPFADAGARFRAATQSFDNITVTGGTGIVVDLVSTSAYSSILSGVEILAVDPAGVANPTANVQVSTDNGGNWTTVASNLPIDRYGQGSYLWTAGTPTAGIAAKFRVLANNGSQPQDDSDAPFQISNNGTQYYVSTSGDDNNSGKDPAQPMKTLAALIDAYDLDAGDTVHVASGGYTLYRNIVIGSQDSGLTIQGPADATAILNRANANSTRYAFELRNADNVTLDRLQMTGAEGGVVAADNSDSDFLTVSNGSIFANSYAGVLLGSTNDRALITGNTLHGIPGGTAADDQPYGILLNTTSTDHVVSNNTLYDHYYAGITLRGARSTASGNNVYGNRVGIDAQYYGVSADAVTVSGNSVHDNIQYGIYATSNVAVVGNRVFGQISANYYGIFANSGVEASGNEIFGNANGLFGAYGTYLHDNRLYNNSNIAVTLDNDARAVANKIYSNSIGIRANYYFYGQIADNLIYANTNRGISVQNPGNYYGTAEILSNTIYQAVGDAIRLDAGARNNRLANNLLWVESGYDIYVAPDSQTGVLSDYNLLYQGVDVNAHVGFWNNAVRDLLSDWQTASTLDMQSVNTDPAFVDIDGADNVLGYTAAGGGNDGGKDDNFYRAKLSPAIDRGDSWNAPATDIEGFFRVDDPGTANAGRPDLVPAVLPTSQFTATGTAQNWRSNGTYFTYNFAGGFSFPFYDGVYNSVTVSTEGFLQFANVDLAYNGANTTAELLTHRRIAAFWDNLRTYDTGDDIFVDTSVAGQVKFRWNATNELDNSDVNFAIVLFQTGQIRFDYGAGNTNLTPTVGISMGNGRAYKLVSGYDGAASLTSANSVMFDFQSGYADIGAYEFRGNSNDVAPPTVSATVPVGIQTGGTISVPVTQIGVTFSEEVNPIDANAAAAYELRGAGPNGTFDDADDVLYVLTPHYAPGQNTATLTIAGPTAPLPGGNYRLTVFGRLNSAIHDLAGLRLDGDANGSAGGDYVRVFNVPTATTTMLVATPNPTTGGTLITFTATVAPSPGASGTVTFNDNGASIAANVALVGGVATFQISSLASGTHPITAVYSGSAAAFFAGSTSNQINEVVNANATTTTLSAGTPNPATPAQAVSFTVTVAGGTSTDGETVVLKDASNGDAIVPTTGGPLAGGSETLIVAAGALSVGTHNLYAVYEGDNFNAGSPSSQVTQTIAPASAPPTLTGIAVNGGSAFAAYAGIQRSKVVSLQLSFDQAVTLDPGAFGLAVHAANFMGLVPTLTAATPDGGLSWIITFSGPNTDPNTSLPPTVPANGIFSLVDGVYDLTVNASLVRLANAPSVTGAGTTTQTFYRLFGEVSGEEPLVGNVHSATDNTTDNLQFRAAFNSVAGAPSTQYRPYFDFDGDGQVNTTDNLQFRTRFNRPLTWTL